MSEPVLKSAGMVLIQTPDVLIQNGSVQVATRAQDPNAEYLKQIPKYLRSFEDAVSYPPNQSFIGNIHPKELEKISSPWYENGTSKERFGRDGEIMPQDEFYLLLKFSDTFDLVHFSPDFIKEGEKIAQKHPILKDLDLNLKEGTPLAEIQGWVDAHEAEGLYINSKLVGCVKQAHDSDETLSAHVILENLCVKASGILPALWMIKNSGISIKEIEYVIECSEEACGDINQRGGGNFAKAIAEKIGCVNATGSDVRGFCAAPAHAFVQASALVKSGIYRNVMVVAGGAIAKLAMNGKDHVKKEMPILEDCLGGFAFLVGENDGVSPIINTNVIGRHTVGTGSSPQAVMSSLISDPLLKAKMSVKDVDLYSAEMQNPEITKPAGAGDVPEANYKMIAALGVMKKMLERDEIATFVAEHGMPGFAPTQGHIPSGVPFLGHALHGMKGGTLNNCLIVGKGSLFLGRMTNLFDGVSFLVEKNSGKSESVSGYDEGAVRALLAKAMEEVAKKLADTEE